MAGEAGQLRSSGGWSMILKDQRIPSSSRDEKHEGDAGLMEFPSGLSAGPVGQREKKNRSPSPDGSSPPTPPTCPHLSDKKIHSSARGPISGRNMHCGESATTADCHFSDASRLVGERHQSGLGWVCFAAQTGAINELPRHAPLVSVRAPLVLGASKLLEQGMTANRRWVAD